jgi:hypothetical protein
MLPRSDIAIPQVGDGLRMSLHARFLSSFLSFGMRRCIDLHSDPDVPGLRIVLVFKGWHSARTARFLKDCVVRKVWIRIKVKVQFALEQATKAQRGSRGTALLFL